MSYTKIIQTTEAHYSGAVERHGASFKGVDWGSNEGQQIRFDELLKPIDLKKTKRITDYGCGYGALLDHLEEKGYKGEYQGFDISEAMINKAEDLHQSKGNCVFFTANPSRLSLADYTLASGIFNVRLETPVEEWSNYILHTLVQLANLSIDGFVFNVLSSHTPHELREGDLFYADPRFISDYCRKTFSDNVTISHDYPLPDFTVCVKFKS